MWIKLPCKRGLQSSKAAVTFTITQSLIKVFTFSIVVDDRGKQKHTKTVQL